MSAGGRHRRRVVVVGNGMATDRLLDELHSRAALSSLDVVVVGEEVHGAYNRILLPRVLSGARPATIVTKPAAWYAQHGVTFVPGRRVQRLDLASRRAHIGNGDTIGYDVAVLATGSSPTLPPVAGIHGRHGRPTLGVHVLRSLDHCLALRRDLARRQPGDVVVVGGGLLGLEAARTIRELGHRLTVVHPVDHLMNAQLDEAGGTVLRSTVEALGLNVVTGRAEAVLHQADPDGTTRGEALLLDDGRILPAEVVVFTTGVRPRVDVAVASGIETNHGVIVDDRLATSAPDVYAIGECAEHRGTTFGLVAPCWDQAEVLADRLSGAQPDARYRGTPVYARLKVAEVDVASLGVVDPGPDDEVLEVVERRRRVYRKLVVRHGRLVGAVLVGDASPAARLIRLLDRGESLPRNPLDVFCSADAYRTSAVTDDVLCTCNRVSGEAVAGAIGAGCQTVDQIGQATRAGTGCGSCVSDIRRLLERQPAAAA